MFEGRKSGSATQSQWSTLEVVDKFGSLGSCGEDSRDEDPMLLVQTERAGVKQLVVQRT